MASPGDTPDSGHARLTDRGEAMQQLQQSIQQALRKHGYPEASAFAVRLALEEALTNAFQHGGATQHGADVTWNISSQQSVFSINDNGEGFTPEDIPDPRTEERLTVPSGRGLLLMRAYMNSIQYNDTGNTVTMTYNKPT